MTARRGRLIALALVACSYSIPSLCGQSMPSSFVTLPRRNLLPILLPLAPTSSPVARQTQSPIDCELLHNDTLSNSMVSDMMKDPSRCSPLDLLQVGYFFFEHQSQIAEAALWCFRGLLRARVDMHLHQAEPPKDYLTTVHYRWYMQILDQLATTTQNQRDQFYQSWEEIANKVQEWEREIPRNYDTTWGRVFMNSWSVERKPNNSLVKDEIIAQEVNELRTMFPKGKVVRHRKEIMVEPGGPRRLALDLKRPWTLPEQYKSLRVFYHIGLLRRLEDPYTSAHEKRSIIDTIESNPGAFDPGFLLVSVALHYALRERNKQKAAMWCARALFRIEIDTAMSQDPALEALAEKHSLEFFDAIQRAWGDVNVKLPTPKEIEEWDRTTPRDYDRKWASLHSTNFFYGKEREYLPEEKLDEILELGYKNLAEKGTEALITKRKNPLDGFVI